MECCEIFWNCRRIKVFRNAQYLWCGKAEKYDSKRRTKFHAKYLEQWSFIGVSIFMESCKKAKRERRKCSHYQVSNLAIQVTLNLDANFKSFSSRRSFRAISFVDVISKSNIIQWIWRRIVENKNSDIRLKLEESKSRKNCTEMNV